MIILVVDDNEDIRELISLVIYEEYPHCRILEAANGNEAIKGLEDYGDRIQGIICDYSMPEGNGFLVFQGWRENFHHIPFILFSSEIEEAKKEFIKNNIELQEISSLFFMGKEKGTAPLKTIIQSFPEISFLKLPLGRVKPQMKLSFPIYVSLNGRRLIKHTHEDDILDKDRFYQLKEKGVEHFYVPYKNIQEKGYRWPIIKVSPNERLSLKDQLNNFKEIHQALLAGIVRKPRELDDALRWLDTTINQIGEEEAFERILNGNNHNDNYVVHHSFLTLLLSMMAIKELGINRKRNREILCYGILFHDLLKSDERAYQRDLDESDHNHSQDLEYKNKVGEALKTLAMDNDSLQVIDALIFGLHDHSFRPRMGHKLALIALIGHRISNDLYRNQFISLPQEKGIKEKNFRVENPIEQAYAALF